MTIQRQSTQSIAIAAPATHTTRKLIGMLAAATLTFTGAGAAITNAPTATADEGTAVAAARATATATYRTNVQLADAVDYYWSQRNVGENGNVFYFPAFADGSSHTAVDGTSQDLTLNDAGGHVGMNTVRKYTNYTYKLAPGRALNVTVSNNDGDNTDDWNMFTLAMHQSGVDAAKADQVVVHVDAPGVGSPFPGIRYDANNRGRTVVDWLKGGQGVSSLTNLISFTGEPYAVGGVYQTNPVRKGAISESLGVRNTTDQTQTITVSVLPGILDRSSGEWDNWGHWNVRFTEGIFTDVNGSTPHHDDVDWLVKQGITTGYEDGSFGGMRDVVRQDMAAFLYRLAGSPAYTPNDKDKARFRDVHPGDSHYKEILWLGHEGIAQGFADGTFGGMRTVVRQDMAAFLHRYAKKFGAKADSGTAKQFTDVNANTPHADDIAWLAKTGVTTGFDNGNGTRSFGGARSVVRQDMAAFLHRMRTNVLK